MRVEDHYRRWLKLPKPWRVSGVGEDLVEQRVTVRIDWPEGEKGKCPVCGKAMPIYDRMEERSWRHLSVMEYRLEIRCAVPRCQCKEHGVKSIGVPWAQPGSRFTLHFEAFAVEVIEACRSLSQAAKLLGLHWSSVQKIMEQAVERGMARRSTEGIKRVGLDEKSFKRGQSYISLMTDIDKQRVVEVVAERGIKACVRLWESIPKEQREKVEAAAMDMGAPCIIGTQQAAPHVAIVHDRFHVSKPLHQAVDKTRRQESAKLAEEGDKTLKKTRFLWLHGQTPEDQKERFEELLETNLRTARAWAYKAQRVEFWHQPNAEAGSAFFHQWYRTVMRSRLPEIKKVAKSLKEHLGGLLTFFKHRITNAITEGFNSKIQAIRADARGFRSFKNYRTRILFFCAKLDLSPQLPSPFAHTKT